MFAIKNQPVFYMNGKKTTSSTNSCSLSRLSPDVPTQDFHVLTFGFAAAAVAIRNLVFVLC